MRENHDVSLRIPPSFFRDFDLGVRISVFVAKERNLRFGDIISWHLGDRSGTAKVIRLHTPALTTVTVVIEKVS